MRKSIHTSRPMYAFTHIYLKLPECETVTYLSGLFWLKNSSIFIFLNLFVIFSARPLSHIPHFCSSPFDFGWAVKSTHFCRIYCVSGIQKKSTSHKWKWRCQDAKISGAYVCEWWWMLMMMMVVVFDPFLKRNVSRESSKWYWTQNSNLFCVRISM